MPDTPDTPAELQSEQSQTVPKSEQRETMLQSEKTLQSKQSETTLQSEQSEITLEAEQSEIRLQSETTQQSETELLAEDLRSTQKSQSKHNMESVPQTDRLSSPKRANTVRTLVNILLFAIGLAIFLYPLAVNYLNYREAQTSMDAYDLAVARMTESEQRQVWDEAKLYNSELGKPQLRDPFQYKDVQSPLEQYFQTLNIDGKGMMAYVEIPKIHLKLPIYHGTTDEVLLKGSGHIATTHLPTDDNSIHPVITGHTGETGYIFFDNLTQLRDGDVFQIHVLNHHLSYKIDRISVILPTDTTQLQPVPNKNYVTLLTCTPYGVNSHRLLVRAHFIGENMPSTQAHGVPVWVMWLLLLAVLVLALLSIYVRRKQRKAQSAMVMRALVGVRIVIIPAIVLAAWASFGLMMKTGFLPTFDLGYSWCDAHVWYFFDIVPDR